MPKWRSPWDGSTSRATTRRARDCGSAGRMPGTPRRSIRAAAGAGAGIEASLARSEPLAMLLRKRVASEAFSGRRFLEARANDEEKYADIGASSARHASTGAAWRDKSGDEGLLRLKLRAAP